jgi:N-acylneuraminate cytidylyltransferase/CMP-N,N'-diacetyllegionaminic acid synthase
VHAVRQVEARADSAFETVVDLDATSPLRLVADIVGTVELLESSGAASVITGCEAHRSPYFNLVERDAATGVVSLSKTVEGGVLRRQDAPAAFDMNASVYAWRRDALFDGERVFFPSTLLFEMPVERSHDIDSELDFRIVEWLMESREENADG